MRWVLHVLGVDNLSGPWYGFWSGAGSDIGELAIVGGLVTLVKHRTCHVHRCWRLGRHQILGTLYTVCRRHHPDGHLTASQVAESQVSGGSTPFSSRERLDGPPATTPPVGGNTPKG